MQFYTSSGVPFYANLPSNCGKMPSKSRHIKESSEMSHAGNDRHGDIDSDLYEYSDKIQLLYPL